MKYLKTINELLSVTDYKLPIYERSRNIDESEFLEIFKTHCQNFSFDNDQLYRLKENPGDLQVFTPMPRNAKPVAFPDFFNKIEGDPEYPVVRKNSLIGGTHLPTLKRLIDHASTFYVIPFDGSELVFCPIFDLWALSDREGKYNKRIQKIGGKDPGKEHFVKVSYDRNFKIPEEELRSIKNDYSKYGYEFFTSSPCLLISDSKIDWLKNNI